jgi:hypothetical protein
MENLFNATDREALLARIGRVRAESRREWGKMDAAQMFCHCARVVEYPTRDRVTKQLLIGKLLAPFFKASFLGGKPFSKNGPTEPRLVVTDQRDLAVERERLVALIEKLVAHGPAAASGAVHPFFGALTGEEWGRMMFKHLDHHLRQFGE